jgi:hypothetical protein
MSGGERCEDGRLFRHSPSHDDPYYEYDVGECPVCNGKGCEKIAICPTCRGERRVKGQLCQRCGGTAQIWRCSLRPDEIEPFGEPPTP